MADSEDCRQHGGDNHTQQRDGGAINGGEEGRGEEPNDLQSVGIDIGRDDPGGQHDARGQAGEQEGERMRQTRS